MNQTDKAPGPTKAADRVTHRGLVFAVIAMALMMMSINGTIVATALEALQDGLGTTISWAGWTITAYAFGVVLMLPISGKLNQHFGHYRVFMVSVLVFVAASLLCGLATNIHQLIVLRVLQAVGGAGFTPSATGIIVDQFGDQRDRAVGLFGSIFPVGAMIGPIFGGFFVDYWSWRGIFFVNVPIGLAVLLLAWRLIPRDHPPANDAGHMDPLGLGLLGLGLLAGMLSASYMAETDVHEWSWLLLLPVITMVLALVMFVRHIGRHAHPFIAPALVFGRGFASVNLINFLYGGLGSGMMVLTPLYAIKRYGFSAVNAGTLLVAQGIAAIVFSTLATFLLRRSGYRLPIYVGLSLIALGIALMALRPAQGVSPYLWLSGAAFIVGVGSGFLSPASRNAGLQLAPQQAANIAALRSMGMSSGRIASVSAATAILSATTNPVSAQASIYVGAALLLLASMLIVRHVPEHHGAW